MQYSYVKIRLKKLDISDMTIIVSLNLNAYFQVFPLESVLLIDFEE